jgi:hypothetical protein
MVRGIAGASPSSLAERGRGREVVGRVTGLFVLEDDCILSKTRASTTLHIVVKSQGTPTRQPRFWIHFLRLCSRHSFRVGVSGSSLTSNKKWRMSPDAIMDGIPILMTF